MLTARRLRWLLVALAAAILLGGAIWALDRTRPSESSDRSQEASPRVGAPAPDLTLSTIARGDVTLSEQRGKVVVLNLWATWCPPCRAEMPALQRTYDDLRDEGLEILAVNTTFQDSRADATDFVEELGLTFPILFDTSGEASRAYELRAMPSTFFIDRQGVIREIVFGGPMSEDFIRTTLGDLLAEPP